MDLHLFHTVGMWLILACSSWVYPLNPICPVDKLQSAYLPLMVRFDTIKVASTKTSIPSSIHLRSIQSRRRRVTLRSSCCWQLSTLPSTQQSRIGFQRQWQSRSQRSYQWGCQPTCTKAREKQHSTCCQGMCSTRSRLTRTLSWDLATRCNQCMTTQLSSTDMKRQLNRLFTWKIISISRPWINTVK